MPGIMDCPFYEPAETWEYRESNPLGLGRVAAITGALFTFFILVLTLCIGALLS